MLTDEAKRLRLFMKKEKITQVELAKMVNTSQPFISRYLSGEYEIPIDLIKFLHLKYNLSYEWFYHNTGKMKSVPVNNKTLISDVTNLRAAQGATQGKLESLEKIVRKLYADFYDNLLNNNNIKSDATSSKKNNS